jgi:peptidoglycan/xylan/chitin deacetylase (PgdA/CDA1 family)
MSTDNIELSQESRTPAAGRHLVTLAFDDGFLDSFPKVAAIYEKYGLSASFNVVAKETEKFGLWNELQERGHEIMPHGYRHANYSRIDFSEGKSLIQKCLEVFSERLDNFCPLEAVFHFPYNTSTPELEAWLSEVVMAYRTGGGGINRMPCSGTRRLTCTAVAPKLAYLGDEHSERHLDEQIRKLLSRPNGWLIYNTHGVDGEGYGPIGSLYLERLLERLIAIESVEVIPPGKALKRV